MATILFMFFNNKMNESNIHDTLSRVLAQDKISLLPNISLTNIRQNNYLPFTRFILKQC